jgi:hypothetical protein
MMTRMMKVALLALVVALAYCPPSLQADPITYIDTLQPGVPVTGTQTQPAGNQSNPIGAQYYMFSATAGASVDIFGDRLDGAYDMSFWVINGVYTDTTQIGLSFPGSAALLHLETIRTHRISLVHSAIHTSTLSPPSLGPTRSR